MENKAKGARYLILISVLLLSSCELFSDLLMFPRDLNISSNSFDLGNYFETGSLDKWDHVGHKFGIRFMKSSHNEYLFIQYFNENRVLVLDASDFSIISEFHPNGGNSDSFLYYLQPAAIYSPGDDNDWFSNGSWYDSDFNPQSINYFDNIDSETFSMLIKDAPDYGESSFCFKPSFTDGSAIFTINGIQDNSSSTTEIKRGNPYSGAATYNNNLTASLVFSGTEHKMYIFQNGSPASLSSHLIIVNDSDNSVAYLEITATHSTITTVNQFTHYIDFYENDYDNSKRFPPPAFYTDLGIITQNFNDDEIEFICFVNGDPSTPLNKMFSGSDENIYAFNYNGKDVYWISPNPLKVYKGTTPW